jgi:hypothetical protein
LDFDIRKSPDFTLHKSDFLSEATDADAFIATRLPLQLEPKEIFILYDLSGLQPACFQSH